MATYVKYATYYPVVLVIFMLQGCFPFSYNILSPPKTPPCQEVFTEISYEIVCLIDGRWVVQPKPEHNGHARPPEMSEITLLPPATPYTPPVAAPQPKANYSIQVKMEATQTCGYCQQARNYFRQRNIQYEEIDVSGQEKSVPIIHVCGQTMQGWSQSRFEHLYRACHNRSEHTNSDMPTYSKYNSDHPSSANFVVSQIEEKIHLLVNQYRLSRGLAALENNSLISQVARQHSENLAQTNYALGHDGFDTRVATLSVRLPIRSSAENIAYNYGDADPAQRAVQQWLDSSGHHKNIVGNYNYTGVGVAEKQGKFYFTQLFLKTN